MLDTTLLDVTRVLARRWAPLGWPLPQDAGVDLAARAARSALIAALAARGEAPSGALVRVLDVLGIQGLVTALRVVEA